MIMVASLLTFCVGWYIVNIPSVPEPVEIKQVEVVKPVVEEPIAPTPVDYIREIDNPSSEINGEWLGLCIKDTIKTVDDFRIQVEYDEVLSGHFKNFRWDTAEIRVLEKPAKAKVSHRKGDIILPSKKLITLPKGDRYITDGDRMVRTHCCNDIKPDLMDDFQPYTPPPKDPKPVPILYIPPYLEREEPGGVSVSKVKSASAINYAHGIGGGGYRYYPSDPPKPSDAPVPEPETWLLFGTGLLLLICRKKFLTRNKK